MKNLILLTNEFPYGSWEPYLETEIKYYSDFFDKVTIFSLQLRKEHKKVVRKIPSEFICYPIDYASKVIYILYFFIIIFDANLYKELMKLKRIKKLNFICVFKLLVFLSRSHYEKNKVLKILKQSYDKEDQALLYSYRFEYQPYVAILIKRKYKNFKIITRAHRYDLYEEENKAMYIPLREFILKNIERLYLISDDGYNYIKLKYPDFKDKISISRLGTIDFGENEVVLEQKLKLVSCSNIVPVKRIDKIITSLSKMKECEIQWTHYGSGVLQDEVQGLAANLLIDSITYDFKGNIENSKLLEDYKKSSYHIFLNVSSSEGIPVSIMEAMSFGIPCIATNVGGTNEIILNNYNGFLLDKDFDDLDLINLINKIKKLEVDEYRELRKNCRSYWEEHYSSKTNYQSFLKEITKFY